MSTPEGRVKDELKGYLNELGAYWYMPVGFGMGAATVDFLVCLPMTIKPAHVGRRLGVFMGMEAKIPGVEPTMRQERVLVKVQSAGGVALCAHGAYDLIRHLKNEGIS